MRRPDTKTDKHTAIARRMARVIIDTTQARGSCTEADLLRSFSRADIAAHGDAARDIAAERLGDHQLAA